jgi:plastocyanin
MWGTKARLGILVAAGVLFLAACGGGGDDPAGEETGASTTGGTGTTEETGTTGTDAGEYLLTAPEGSATTGFEPTALEVPAGEPFDLSFDNQDPGIPHNVVIYAGDSAEGTPVFSPPNGETVTGEDEVVYQVPALDAGAYTFICSVHPTTMVGTLTAA